MSWTDERVELLKTLWQAGHSATEIAAELGEGLTRNAVIAKVHRLGVSERKKGFQRTVAPRERKSQPRTRYYAPRKTAGNLELKPEPIEEIELLEVPVEQRKTLLQLNEHTCRWPVGNPGEEDFYFCGGEPAGDLPYCAYHCRVAYQPAAERRRPPAPRIKPNF